MKLLEFEIRYRGAKGLKLLRKEASGVENLGIKLKKILEIQILEDEAE